MSFSAALRLKPILLAFAIGLISHFIYAKLIRENDFNRQKKEHRVMEYTVVSGDSLRKIARKMLGKEAFWKSIYELNKNHINDMTIRPGQKLKIPLNTRIE